MIVCAELAKNYKDEGVHYFKHRKYRLAVISFTEGLKPKGPDSDLRAQLLNNRAAAHYRMCALGRCLGREVFANLYSSGIANLPNLG